MVTTAKPRRRSPALRRSIGKAALAAIERDRWIGYPIGDAGLCRLNELYTMRARVRMPCLLIYGVSGAGKSMLLEKFKRDHAPKRANRNGQRPIIATQMPPVPVVRSLYGEIVRTLGGNVRPTARFYELEHAAISLLTHANPRILIIDEIQHLLSCSAREQRAALNMVKFLSNDRRISVVAAGTHEALHVMRFDPQIAADSSRWNYSCGRNLMNCGASLPGIWPCCPFVRTPRPSTSVLSSTSSPLPME
jgi:hypothetical protein